MQRGSATQEDKLVTSKYYLDNYMLRPGVQHTPAVMHELFQAILKHPGDIMRKMHNARSEHGTFHGESNVFQDNRQARAQHMREICAMLGVGCSHQVEAVIDNVVMEKTCLQILEKKEALRVAFGLRYQESEQRTAGNVITKRGLEILNARLGIHSDQEGRQNASVSCRVARARMAHLLRLLQAVRNAKGNAHTTLYALSTWTCSPRTMWMLHLEDGTSPAPCNQVQHFATPHMNWAPLFS